MSTVTPKRFQTILLTTGSVDMYTAPALTSAVIKRLSVTNITASPATVTITLTPSGGSAITLTGAVNVPANTASVLNEWANVVLNPGDKFSALAGTGTALNLSANGFTVV